MLWRGDWRDESGTAQPGLSDSQWTEERHAEKSEALIRFEFFLVRVYTDHGYQRHFSKVFVNPLKSHWSISVEH